MLKVSDFYFTAPCFACGHRIFGLTCPPLVSTHFNRSLAVEEKTKAIDIEQKRQREVQEEHERLNKDASEGTLSEEQVSRAQSCSLRPKILSIRWSLLTSHTISLCAH